MYSLPEELTFQPYKTFPPLPLKVVIDSWTEEQISQWESSYNEIKGFNVGIENYNGLVERRWREVFKNKKIKSSKGSLLGWYKEFLNAIGKPSIIYPPRISDIGVMINNKMYRGYELLNISPTTLHEVVTAFRKKIEAEQKTSVKENELTLKLLELAQKYHINPQDYATVGKFYDAIKCADKEFWVTANYPDGMEMDISVCSECDIWVVGEHRCSCGNRRMMLEVEGNALDGYYAYSYAY